MLSSSCPPAKGCLATLSSLSLIFFDQLPSVATSYPQGSEAQTLFWSGSALISAHLVKCNFSPLPQWMYTASPPDFSSVLCIHSPLPFSNFFLSFPDRLWLEVKETTANYCWIQHLPSSPLQWIAFCSRILEKYANFISRRMAYSSCFYWNESAGKKQECMSVVPTFLCPSVSLCLPGTAPLHEDSPGSLLHFFRILSHLYDHLTKETKKSPYHLFLIYDFLIRSQPQGPYICWFKNERKLLFQCVSSSQWPCSENNSESMLISLRNGQ